MTKSKEKSNVEKQASWRKSKLKVPKRVAVHATPEQLTNFFEDLAKAKV